MILDLRNIKSFKVDKLFIVLSSFPFTNRTINSLSKCSNGITARLLNRSLSAKVLNGTYRQILSVLDAVLPTNIFMTITAATDSLNALSAHRPSKPESRFTSPLVFKCPYCGRTLSPIKNREILYCLQMYQ